MGDSSKEDTAPEKVTGYVVLSIIGPDNACISVTGFSPRLSAARHQAYKLALNESCQSNSNSNDSDDNDSDDSDDNDADDADSDTDSDCDVIIERQFECVSPIVDHAVCVYFRNKDPTDYQTSHWVVPIKAPVKAVISPALSSIVRRLN